MYGIITPTYWLGSNCGWKASRTIPEVICMKNYFESLVRANFRFGRMYRLVFGC